MAAAWFILGFQYNPPQPPSPQSGVVFNEDVGENTLVVKIVAPGNTEELRFDGIPTSRGIQELNNSSHSSLRYNKSSMSIFIRNYSKGDGFVLTDESYNQTHKINVIGVLSSELKQEEDAFDTVIIKEYKLRNKAK